jgi:hypothetical protein
VDVEDLAPRVRPTADFDDPRAVELVEPGIGVGLQEAREAGQMRRRPFAFAVRRGAALWLRCLAQGKRPVMAPVGLA